MMFSSGEHVFKCFNVLPQPTAKDQYLNIILDVPYTEELFGELNLFLWKDVKIKIREASGKDENEIEVYVAYVKPKPYKEGARIRVFLSQPFERKTFQRVNKLLFQDVTFEMEETQGELFEEQDEG